ncbi:unnamed protein product [Arabidopsis arenosa]|uniref:Ubiquitin-like protease family profile domain-containing protein n=1 Tax=Arabidopsis arenosa TaxID=38785 RepID=A0A8S2AFJ4_ARAAE|nr:unnamed protein product [Arabidopsis arenosa]
MADVDLPSRLFADCEEPAGDRVNQYFKLHTIKTVLKALQPEELDLIRPCFGKLLDVYSKPVFSGKLAHFLLTRQLNVVKRHEIWVVFAGKPFRFSLREFGLVTGLNCNPIPPIDRSLTKCPPGVIPYWFTLFGGEENFTGEMLLAKLRRPKALTSELRVKYACLFLVDGLLGRRSYHMKIPRSHAELIRDLDTFLAYPWGRYSFDMTMRCIKSRSLSQLAQSTVAVQGFIHALVLTFVEAVPAVVSAVGDCTDPESGDEDVFPVISLNLDTVWLLDGKGKVEVLSIIPSDDAVAGLEDCSWSDEVSDPAVDLMLRQIADGVQFRRDMFQGGVRGSDVQVDPPPRVTTNGKRKTRSKTSQCTASKAESSRAKKSKARSGGRTRCPPPEPTTSILESVSALIRDGLREGQSDVYATVCVEMKAMELRLERCLKENVCAAVSAALSARVVDNVLGDLAYGYEQHRSQPSPSLHPTHNHPNANKTAVHAQPLVDGTSNGDGMGEELTVPPANVSRPEGDSSVGTTEASSRTRVSDEDTGCQVDTAGDVASPVQGGAEHGIAPMSEKFQKLMVTLTPTMKFSFGEGLVLKDSQLLSIPTVIPPDTPQVMDACVSVLRDSLFQNTDPDTDPRADLLPCKFYGTLASVHGKFKKCKCKSSFEFEESFLADVSSRFKLTGRSWLSHVDSLLAPFNIDKNRWVGVLVHLPSHTLTVFDPTAAVRRGTRLKPELDFICQMFPYLVRKVGDNELTKNFPLHPLTFDRNTHVAQASDVANSGMLSLLFLEAHATGGLDKVYLVTERDMRQRAEQLVVEMYEHCFGDLGAA